jgi:hypothetical protein
MADETAEPTNTSRRDFVKRAAYVAPAVLTLTAVSATAKAGSAPPRRRPPGPPSWTPPGRRRRNG